MTQIVSEFSASVPKLAPGQAIGQVIKYHSDRYTVQLQDHSSEENRTERKTQRYQCLLKGLLKKEQIDVLAGDRVIIDALDEANHQGRIIEILPRRNSLTRPKIANVDQVIVLQPLKDPDFDFEQLDRFLTQVRLANIPAIIGLSKSDLVTGDEGTALKADILKLYQEQLGYPVFFLSIHDTESLAALEATAQNQISVLAGISGAGKSSLLNALNPALNLKVQAVSEKISRGQHTTRHVELLEVKPNLWISDTPGFSHLKFDSVLPNVLEKAFPEFQNREASCQFSDCLHVDEQGCQIRRQSPTAEDDEIPTDNSTDALKIITSPEIFLFPGVDPRRYSHYRAMLVEAKAFEASQAVFSQKDQHAQARFKTIQKKGRAVKIIKLSGKQRDAGRNTQRQNWQEQWQSNEDDTE